MPGGVISRGDITERSWVR